MMARIKGAGTVKRAEASAMKLAKRSMDGGRAGVCALALNSKNVDAAMMHMECAITTIRRGLSPSDPRHAIKSVGTQI